MTEHVLYYCNNVQQSNMAVVHEEIRGIPQPTKLCYKKTKQTKTTTTTKDPGLGLGLVRNLREISCCDAISINEWEGQNE